MAAEKEAKGVEAYTMSSMVKLKGFIKNGFDTSTIINVIVSFDSEFEEFRQRGFTFPPNLFFYHEVSWSETIGVLINEHKLSKEEAITALRKLIAKFNLQKVVRLDFDDLLEKLVEEANQRVAKKFNNPGLKIGDNDVIIIGGFLREKINFVHSGDEGFLKTCEELGINTVRLPERDFMKEKEIKGWMKKGRKD
ncbi:hypothetical protein J4421_05360 [Candidatus Woesearchaeota archaeon]|nr:hypothetical protein [Candidatus Woesearchaeota archaeon]